ncbi:hypothetical protein ACIGKR_31935 [Rhodococcus qingshengii]|uniref:hypothetical protein n=1 Tax=Rhodococcus qingshengii TaxID=334542 RepID=UPI0037C57742
MSSAPNKRYPPELRERVVRMVAEGQHDYPSDQCHRSPVGDRHAFPMRGLARGSVVVVDGASSVLVSLLASVAGSGKHAAIIGLPKLGLLAATEMGADLARCALIPSPGAVAIDVAAILLDGIDLVILGLSGAAVTPPRARVVVARARSKGNIFVVTQRQWDGPDLRIESTVGGYAA